MVFKLLAEEYVVCFQKILQVVYRKNKSQFEKATILLGPLAFTFLAVEL
jgi:hypothetical protein